MLAKVYLVCLQLRFKIYKIISKIEGDELSTRSDLLEISAKMLDTSVHIANARTREGYFPYPVDLTSYVSGSLLLNISECMTDLNRLFNLVSLLRPCSRQQYRKRIGILSSVSRPV